MEDTMQKKLVMLLLMAGMTNLCGAQLIPKGVQDIIDNYVNTPYQFCGFFDLKVGFEDLAPLKPNDIKTGVPVEVYNICDDLLNKSDDNTPIQSLIKPAGEWYLPILLKSTGKCLYLLEIRAVADSFKLASAEEGGNVKYWNDFSAIWPESKDNTPILIFHGLTRYYHFPKKGKYNLMYVKGWDIEMDMRIADNPKHYSTLEDSRKLMKVLKADIIKKKNEEQNKSPIHLKGEVGNE
jgi:hypothetical protein